MIPWDDIPEFSRSEFDDPLYPGSGDQIDPEFFGLLLVMRRATEWSMIIHTAVGGAVDLYGSHGHAPNSLHLKKQGCKAVDFHFGAKASPREQVFALKTFGFGGIGIYYDWKWNGKPLSVGFHVDTRPADRCQIWTREVGKYIYLLK